MSTHSPHSIAGQIGGARLTLANTLSNSEIAERVASFGYGPAQLQEGQRYCDTAIAAVIARAEATDARRNAVQQTEVARKQAIAAYQSLAGIVRALFAHEPHQLVALRLVGSMPESYAGFLRAAYWLFNSAETNQEVRNVLAEHGYATQQFSDGFAVIRGFEQALQAQRRTQAAAKRATEAQYAALKDLDRWIRRYRRIAKLALKDKSDLIAVICPPRPRRAPKAKPAAKQDNAQPGTA